MTTNFFDHAKTRLGYLSQQAVFAAKEYNEKDAAYASWEAAGGRWWCQRPHRLSRAYGVDAARTAVSVAEAKVRAEEARLGLR